MTRTLEKAFAEASVLPDSAQDQIGRELLAHVRKLRRLRADLEKGIQSLDADRRIREIRRSCHKLSRLPHSGRPRDDLIPNVRSILAKPHIVFYRVAGRTIQIVRILHASQDLDAIFVPRRRT
jgi:plasmid stabilization system protein ParE